MIYVVSDIHGHLDKFKALLDMINFNDDDFMYILGDVLDRGNYPIGLLRFIMDKSNMELLMGNHENDAYIILSMLMMEIDSEDTVDKVLTDDFYENYEEEELYKLINFINDYDINDIHYRNVGFLNNLPVIIDYAGY